MSGFGNFAAGFLGGFSQARDRKRQREEENKEKKLRLQLIEIEMDRNRRAQAEADKQARLRDTFFNTVRDRFAGIRSYSLPGTGVRLGDVNATLADSRPPATNLIELLAGGEEAVQAMQAGFPIPQAPQEPADLALRRAFMKDPELLKQELALRSAGATRIDTGDRLGKIPQGYGLVSGSDGKPTLQRLMGAPPTPGQQSLDQAFGQEAADWVMGGRFADSQKSINQLSEAKRRLEAAADSNAADQNNGRKRENLSGPAISKIPEFAKPLFNPAAIEVRDSVEEIVQKNLRLVLGAQFTEKEGERLIARSYNENLSETENAKRLGRIIDQISRAARAKQEAVNYFGQHGTLEGFKGKLWTMADFDPESEGQPSNVIDFNELP